MRSRTSLAGLFVVASLLIGGDVLACGDKFLVGSRGTRYQRPKNSRTASVVIYSAPGQSGAGERVKAFLAKQGHHAVIVTTLEQLASIVSGGGTDVVLAAGDAAAAIQQLVAKAPEPAVVVQVDEHPRPVALLTSIDRAVVQRDKGARKSRVSS
jgi:hypothetical protein